MTRHLCTLLLFPLIQLFVTGAPSESNVSKLAQIAKVETADIKLNQAITLEEATKSDANDAQGHRKKRFNNYFGYGFPPMNPVIYPNYPNSNDPYAGNFAEDPFQQIYRRLQSIASVVRTPTYNQPPPPPQFPVLFPVIYIPYVGCRCTPNQGNKPTRPSQNGTDDGVDISNRFPDMEDERQNWGIVVNNNETEEDDGMPEDFTRPISFVPIRPNRTMSKPPPAVDHGSNQEGRDMTTTTTSMPPPPSTAAPAFSPANSPTPPNACDAAILSCCHHPQVTYDCFVAQGCPDPTSYGNPCEVQTILRVIDRFQRFYGQRTG